MLITTKPGEVIKHGAIKMIQNEGFPTYRDPFNKGRLIVVFNVNFPESLTADDAKKISNALPKPPKVTIPSNYETVKLEEFDGKGKWEGEYEPQEEMMEEDEEPQFHGGGHPQCAQQ